MTMKVKDSAISRILRLVSCDLATLLVPIYPLWFSKQLSERRSNILILHDARIRKAHL